MIATIIRGHHRPFERQSGIRAGPTDWKECHRRLDSFFVQPMRAKGYHTHHVYYHTHTSDVELRKVIRPYRAESGGGNTSGQFKSGRRALALVEQPMRYSFFLWTRFDACLQQNIVPFISPSEFSIPFRQPDGVLNDVLCVFSPAFFHPFQTAVGRATSHMHYRNFSFPIHLWTTTRWYSDTDYPEYFVKNKNPFYKLLRNRTWGFRTRQTAQAEARRQTLMHPSTHIRM